MSARMLRVEPSRPVQDQQDQLSSGTNLQDSAPLADIDIERAIVAALRASGLSESEACRLMKVDASQWSKQKKNVDNAHVSFQRLTKLPKHFWLELLQQLAPALGIVIAHPDLADRAIQQLVLATEAACAFARQDRALRAGGMR
jgi:trans-aconitate methyltransferase